ncbi:MAG: AAA family ATPase [Eubacteriales bacterium]
MSIESVTIKNFTVFNNIEVAFSKGINVIIGENGTGKTHLMKAMYAIQQQSKEKINIFNEYFKSKNENSFVQNEMESGKLILIPNNGETSSENVLFYQVGISDTLNSNEGLDVLVSGLSDNYFEFTYPKTKINTTFITAKDMMTHSEGFMSWYNDRDIPFDKIYYDIISKSLIRSFKRMPDIGKSVLPKIENIIDGKVVIENETFFIEKTDGRKVEFSLEAEGVKKIAILWQLIMNGSIEKDSVLFWDEPEANINPALYKDVAEILLELSRNGVQIFVATHNYSFAKYMEVLSKDSDHVRYHALYKTDEGVKCETETKFARLSNNALRDDNINLYDAEMKKEFEE